VLNDLVYITAIWDNLLKCGMAPIWLDTCPCLIKGHHGNYTARENPLSPMCLESYSISIAKAAISWDGSDIWICYWRHCGFAISHFQSSNYPNPPTSLSLYILPRISVFPIQNSKHITRNSLGWSFKSFRNKGNGTCFFLLIKGHISFLMCSVDNARVNTSKACKNHQALQL